MWGLVNYVETDKDTAIEKQFTSLIRLYRKELQCLSDRSDEHHFKDGVDGFASEVNAFGDIFNSYRCSSVRHFFWRKERQILLVIGSEL